MNGEILCPRCEARVAVHRNPVPTVDLIIRCGDGEGAEGVVLIQRRTPPGGWALPGGFVDYGETLEAAAEREAREETGVGVKGLVQFHAYSDPRRDPRQHTITVVFLAEAVGSLRAGDDARDCAVFSLGGIPSTLAFDHERILRDYSRWRKTGRAPEGS